MHNFFTSSSNPTLDHHGRFFVANALVAEFMGVKLFFLETLGYTPLLSGRSWAIVNGISFTLTAWCIALAGGVCDDGSDERIFWSARRATHLLLNGRLDRIRIYDALSGHGPGTG